ncbi:MAG: Mrp/NBP35 family ATP-binding protein [Bacteroidales bacterium]|nr:Mrp/NBP35 family ATP-binding protein [Bacteroidales bacterium]MCF8390530.1 Mrp/NBP35 family ATP-binding protein [Bacteroidales bacterium]
MNVTKEKILEELKSVKHPETRQNIVDAGMVESLEVGGGKIRFTLKFSKAKDPFSASMKKTAEAVLKKLDTGMAVEINIFTPPVLNFKLADPLAKIKNIIAIASGKGGVGKSTVTVNLAVALAKSGARVGIVDADVYGPSIPKMFDIENQRPEMKKEGDKDIIIPVEKYGVKIVSIGFFVRPEDALVWRGPMATSALKQLINQSDWGELDYLLIDLPPGTGDVHLTIVQETAVTGALIVSTPQDVALADVVKGIAMFKGDKINVPVLGLVENMAWFTPEELPENKYYIFGKDGVKKLAEKMKMELLGQIPIVQGVCADGDSGRPSVLDENNPAGKAMVELAQNLKQAIDKRNQAQPPTKRVEITT